MPKTYRYEFTDAHLTAINAALHVYCNRPSFADFPNEAKSRARRLYMITSEVQRVAFLIPRPDSCGFNLASVASFQE